MVLNLIPTSSKLKHSTNTYYINFMQLYTCYMICLNEDGLERWIKTWLELPRANHGKIGIKQSISTVCHLQLVSELCIYLT